MQFHDPVVLIYQQSTIRFLNHQQAKVFLLSFPLKSLTPIDKSNMGRKSRRDLDYCLIILDYNLTAPGVRCQEENLVFPRPEATLQKNELDPGNKPYCPTSKDTLPQNISGLPLARQKTHIVPSQNVCQLLVTRHTLSQDCRSPCHSSKDTRCPMQVSQSLIKRYTMPHAGLSVPHQEIHVATGL